MLLIEQNYVIKQFKLLEPKWKVAQNKRNKNVDQTKLRVF